VQGVLVGRDGVVRIPSMPQADAIGALKVLLQLWLDGMNAPLPLPSKTALALVAEKNAVTAYEGGYMANAEADEACLARLYPDYDALIEDGRFEDLAHAVYGPLLKWAQQLTAEPHATQEEHQEVAA
jgi:exodeoxyribonuclease V gamma subunit